MTDAAAPQTDRLTWRFPRTFWFANAAELCERAAFYGMFITLLRYLNKDIGFSDVLAGWLVAGFASILYFLPTFMGILADKIGFRRALILAFALLTVGYALLGLAGTPATRYTFASAGQAPPSRPSSPARSSSAKSPASSSSSPPCSSSWLAARSSNP